MFFLQAVCETMGLLNLPGLRCRQKGEYFEFQNPSHKCVENQQIETAEVLEI